MFSPESTDEERCTERQRLQNVFARLVFICEEIEAEIGVIKRGADDRAHVSGKVRDRDAGVMPKMPCSSCDSSPEKEEGRRLKGYSPRLSGSYASFAEAHRVVVMDAVRTDMKPIHEVASCGKPHMNIMGLGGLIPNSNVLPVSGCEGMPELMMVDPPELKPSQAIATGKQPLWKSDVATQMIDGSDHLSSVDKRMMIRLINILSAYAVHDPENGYCQGMSDLAVVFVGLEEDDAVAFACFEKFMRAARQNFRHDEEGIKNQLKEISGILENTDLKLFSKIASIGDEHCMFAYRMVVVLMRRDLPLEDVLTLWEISWAYSIEDSVDRPEPLSHNARMISLKGMDGPPLKSHVLDSTLQSLDKLMKSTEEVHKASRNYAKQGDSPGFMLQFVAAIIKSQRDRIIQECEKPDDLMRLFNRPHIDFWSAIRQARKQHKAYTQGLQVIQSLSS